MRKILVYIFAIVVATVLAVGCGNGAVDSRILAADTLVESHPDSALALLRSIDSSQLRGGRESALYALLLTRAEDRNYIDRTDDSLIKIAVRYFENDDDFRNRMLAYFYHGRILYNAGKYPTSLLSFIKVLNLAKNMDDRFWCGRAYSEMSDISFKTSRYSDHEQYAKKTLDFFENPLCQPYHDYAYIGLSQAYINMERYQESLATAKMALDSATAKGNNYLAHHAKKLIANSLYYLEDYRAAIGVINNTDIDSIKDIDLLFIKEVSLIMLGEKSTSAKAFLDSMAYKTNFGLVYFATAGDFKGDIERSNEALRELVER